FLLVSPSLYYVFCFTDTPTPDIYTLSLHDALPIYTMWWRVQAVAAARSARGVSLTASRVTVSCWPAESRMGVALGVSLSASSARSEEHTSELQSHLNLVCRLLLEKKK